MTSSSGIDFGKFKGLRFEDFRRMATDPSLSLQEKIGFPDSYRDGYGEVIFADIRRKLSNLDQQGQVVFDIGCGCSDLPRMMIDHCAAHGQTLVLIDAQEMLDLLPDAPHVIKAAGYFPSDCGDLLRQYAGKVGAVLAYGVLQVVFIEDNVIRFIDASLSLLADGGQFLIGDIPNVSKRKRFFASNTGIAYHKQFMATDQAPEVNFNLLEPEHMDDGLLLGFQTRARMGGYEAYIVPQPPDLPMANRREDMLFFKP